MSDFRYLRTIVVYMNISLSSQVLVYNYVLFQHKHILCSTYYIYIYCALFFIWPAILYNSIFQNIYNGVPHNWNILLLLGFIINPSYILTLILYQSDIIAFCFEPTGKYIYGTQYPSGTSIQYTDFDSWIKIVCRVIYIVFYVKMVTTPQRVPIKLWLDMEGSDCTYERY